MSQRAFSVFQKVLCVNDISLDEASSMMNECTQDPFLEENCSEALRLLNKFAENLSAANYEIKANEEIRAQFEAARKAELEAAEKAKAEAEAEAAAAAEQEAAETVEEAPKEKRRRKHRKSDQ